MGPSSNTHLILMHLFSNPRFKDVGRKSGTLLLSLFYFLLVYFILFFGKYEFYFIPKCLIVPQIYLFSEMAKC